MIFSAIRELVDIVKKTLELSAQGVEYGEEVDIKNLTLNEYLTCEAKQRDLTSNCISRKREYPESNEEMKPDIENMKLEEYLRNEEFDKDENYRLPPLKPCFQTPQLCTRFNSMPHNSNKEVDIDNMTLEEYELYMAMQCLKMNEVQDPTHGITYQFFNHSTHTPNHPLDKKDIILEEILDDLFSMGAKSLKRMEQEEDQVEDLSGTEPMLDELLEEFRDELLDINVVDEKEDYNPITDIKELSCIVKANVEFGPFIQQPNLLYRVSQSSKSSAKTGILSGYLLSCNYGVAELPGYTIARLPGYAVADLPRVKLLDIFT
ncbi:hypothetical protein Tco_1235157 [Tanacetum coccineum]